MSIYETISIGGHDYDSFESVAAADIYLAIDPNAAAWRALATPEEKGGLLVSATRTLARQPWPAGVIADPLPQAIKDATAELAAAMAGGYDAANQSTTASGLKRQKAGSVEQEFFWSQATSVGTRFPLSVWELIKGLLGGDGAGIGGSFSSGTCGRDISQTDYGYGATAYDDDGCRRACD
jgi:hypothetical protein